MSRLTSFRRRLSWLRTARCSAKWLTGVAVLVSAALLTLGALWGLDVLFELSESQRLLTGGIAAAALLWLFAKFTWPYLILPETPTDLVLLVEQQHGLDNDLVAALEFDTVQTTHGGSRDLAAAVVDQAVSTSHGVNVFAGFPLRALRQRLGLLLLCLVASVLLVLAFPQYAQVFAARWLHAASTHYPTRTRIESLSINGQVVLSAEVGDGPVPVTARAAQAQPLYIEVEASGELPTSGTARLVAADGGTESVVTLERVEGETNANAGPFRYRGLLERLNGPVAYQIELGDAWTEPANVDMIPLPVVQLEIVPHPPEYARQAMAGMAGAGKRIVQVLEGTNVDLTLRCVNQKRLREAVVSVTHEETTWQASLQPSDDDPTVWHYRSNAGNADDESPFRNVERPTRFTLQLVDEDGLEPAGILQGSLRIKSDRPPTANARLVHKVVLPTAKPVIEYRVNDDFGISAVRLVVTVQHPSDELVAVTNDVPAADDVEPEELPSRVIELNQEQVIPGNELPQDASYALDLSSFELGKGDRLKLELEAVDYRGQNPGQAYRGDPLYLLVSDESGVLAAISESDEKSEKQLSDIIKRELGIGDSQ